MLVSPHTVDNESWVEKIRKQNNFCPPRSTESSRSVDMCDRVGRDRRARCKYRGSVLRVPDSNCCGDLEPLLDTCRSRMAVWGCSQRKSGPSGGGNL